MKTVDLFRTGGINCDDLCPPVFLCQDTSPTCLTSWWSPKTTKVCHLEKTWTKNCRNFSTTFNPSAASMPTNNTGLTWVKPKVVNQSINTRPHNVPTPPPAKFETLKCANPTPSCTTLLAAFTTCPLKAQSFLFLGVTKVYELWNVLPCPRRKMFAIVCHNVIAFRLRFKAFNWIQSSLYDL